jgi:hypothetical protein
MIGDSEEQVRLDAELVRLRERLLQLDRDRERYANNSSQYAQRRLRSIEREQRQTRELVRLERERLEDSATLNKERIASTRSFAKLNQDVQKTLIGQNRQNSVYLSISNSVAKSKALQVNLTGDELDAEIERENYLTDINNSLLEQAKTLQKTEATLKGKSEYEQQIEQIRANSLGLAQAEVETLIANVKLQESIAQKNERLLQIQEEQKGLYDAMPESLRSGVEFAKKLGGALKNGALPMVLLASLALAAFKSFSDLDESAKKFREETGLTNSQMEGIKSDANAIVGEFGHLGVNAEKVFDTIAALKSEFSDVADFSKETTAALTVLSTNFGVSAENAAKVQGVLEQVSGLSSETAASVQLQVADMARLAGVAPAKVMADIAESAEVASTLFKGDVNALAKSAIEARRLGTNLKSVAATAEKLLDFEGGIEDELTAATFVGGQFNLSRARALAFEGKIVEAQKETLSQIQKSGDFRKKDYFTQQQLAKAAGMSVEEINKQLDAQDKLNSLTSEQKKAAEDAISKGLDITNINADQLAQETEKFSKQQEQQAVLEKISNAFTGIASTIGSVLVPLFDVLVPILGLVLAPVQFVANLFKEIVGNMTILLPMLAAMGVYLAVAKGEAIKLAFANLKGAIGGIFKSFSQIPLGIGIPLAIGAVAGLVSMFNKVGDLNSPADGKTRVSTKEGGLFELSPNDDLVAAPGVAAALAGGGNQSGGGINLSALAAPMQAMVNEVKALRADLAAGKIAVYMDAQKVTNGVSTAVDQSTRNSYNLGTV